MFNKRFSRLNRRCIKSVILDLLYLKILGDFGVVCDRSDDQFVQKDLESPISADIDRSENGFLGKDVITKEYENWGESPGRHRNRRSRGSHGSSESLKI